MLINIAHIVSLFILSTFEIIAYISYATPTHCNANQLDPKLWFVITAVVTWIYSIMRGMGLLVIQNNPIESIYSRRLNIVDFLTIKGELALFILAIWGPISYYQNAQLCVQTTLLLIIFICITIRLIYGIFQLITSLFIIYFRYEFRAESLPV